MNKKRVWKRIAAWMLTIAMVGGNSNFAVFAQDAEPVAEAEAVTESEIAAEAPVDAQESAPTEGTEAPADAQESAPTEETEAPADAQEIAAEETEAPADAQEIAAEETEAPADAQESAPAEETEVPADVQESAPAEETEAPTDAQEIVAEETEVPESEAPDTAETEVLDELILGEDEVNPGDARIPEDAFAGFVPAAEEGEEDEPRDDILALSWGEYGFGGDERDEEGNLLNPECVYYGTWVFPGSAVTLNVEGLQKLAEMPELGSYTMETRTFLIDDAGEEEGADQYLTAQLSEDKRSITVTGIRPLDDERPSMVELRVLDESGNPAVAARIPVLVFETVEEYYFVDFDPYQYTVFQGERYYLNKVHYQIQTPEHPYWEEGETDIEDVTYTSYKWDEEGNKIPADDVIIDSRKDENGDWYLEAGEFGYADYKASFTLPIGEEGKPGELEGSVYVSGDSWRLDFEYPNYEDDSMLPGETMTIHTTLCHEWRFGEDWGYEEPEDYTLVIPEEQDFGTLDVSVDGHDIIVKAGADGGWFWLEAIAMVDGNDVARHDFTVNVRAEGYFLLRVHNMDEVNNLDPGASVSIDPEYVFISPDEGEVPQDDVKYCLEYDPDILTVTDAQGRELPDASEDQEAGIGTAPFTVTKKSNVDTDARLIAMMRDEDGAYYEHYRINLHFWTQDYSIGFQFKGARGNGCNGGVPMFTDEDREIRADVSSLKERGIENYKIVWKVGRVDEEGIISDPLPADGGYYTVDGDTIILHGAKLAEMYPPQGEDGEDNPFFDVRALLYVNDIPVWEDDGPGFWMNEAYEELITPLYGMNEAWTFPNGTIHFDAKTSYYMKNSDYPDGAEIAAVITGVEIIRNVMWTGEGDIETEEPLFSVEGSAEDGWTLTAGENCGAAYLRLTYEVNQEIKGTYGTDNDEGETFQVYVTGEKEYFELADTEGEMWLHSGEEKTISVKAWREYMGEEGVQTEEVTDYKLEFNLEDGEPSYDTDMMSVEYSGGDTFTISIAEDRTGWQSNLRVQCWVQGEDDPEPWQLGGDIWLLVRVGCADDGHTAGEWKTVIIPTCTEEGMQARYCDDCGIEMDREVISKTGHTAGEVTVTKAATCTAAGEKVTKCAVCGAEMSREEIPKTGHTAGEVTVTKAATCTAMGEKVTKCAVCGAEMSREVIPMTGHTAGEATVTKAATCTADGEKTTKCTVCGAVISTEAIKTAGHTWGTWTEPTKATVFAESTKSRTCSVCGTTETQKVAGRLTPVLKLTANSLKMKTKQTTKKFMVTKMAEGDSVASVTSSNTKVLKVTSLNKTKGTFTLKAQKKKGSAKLTVTLKSGISKRITVKVQSAKVKTTKVSLDTDAKSVALKKGKTFSLKNHVVVAPVTSQDKITYTSSNKKVATVSSKGVIKAKKKGKAKITVKAGKKKVTCTVTVK